MNKENCNEHFKNLKNVEDHANDNEFDSIYINNISQLNTDWEHSNY